MKGILRYTVIKEKEIEFDDDTFSNTSEIQSFWSNIARNENDKVINIKGNWIKDEQGKKVYN